MHPLSTQGDVRYEPVGLMYSFQPSSGNKFATETDNVDSAHNPVPLTSTLRDKESLC